MKILLNHADTFEFEATRKAINNPEELNDNTKSGKASNALVAFMAVEKPDEGNEAAVAEKVVADLEDVYKKVGASMIVVYPYAHLSSNLSSLPSAAKTLNMVYDQLVSKKYKTIKAPFGWYKSFKIACKGHPLAELSREITVSGPGSSVSGSGSSVSGKGSSVPAGQSSDKTQDSGQKTANAPESEALKNEEKMRSSWAIMTPDGNMHPIRYEGGSIKGFDFSNFPHLKKFANYELAKNRDVDKAPPHVELMQKLELVDYEPGSDPGNLRYYPKGRLIKSLLEDFVTQEVKNYGAMEIEAPIMYDFEHPSLKKYLNRFPARQYTIQTPNKKVFLRFAACFGQFLMAHDATISYKNLPMRLYEMTKYSFRVEKRGELTGLRRLRSFTMPDCHAFVSDFDMAKREMITRFELAEKILKKSGIDRSTDLEMGLRIVKDFYEEHKDFVKSLVMKWGKPLLVEMWNDRFFYFVMKYEWNFIDCLDKASALTTDQIDVENAITYDINYTDANGEKKHPLIMHLSPSGAIERIIYALLEKAAADRDSGKIPMLPLWLAPTQVRVIPITERNLEAAREVQKNLEAKGIRADLDDRDLTLGKKVMGAGQEWVPYTAVIGDKEEKEGKLSVTVRGAKGQKGMSPDELALDIKSKTDGLPFKSLPLAAELSKRPIFVG